jgi:GTP-binding protein
VRSISTVDQLRNAAFLRSVAQTAQLPPDHGTEVAFAGRSNSGKSSALNVITGRKTLARVSRTPGRTQLINFFTLPEGQALVDLPGYGYAAVPAKIKAGWDALLGGYLRNRRALRGVILIMDCRHPLGELDHVLLDFCLRAGRPVHVLLSKSDKLGRSERLKTLHAVRERLQTLSPAFGAQLFSAQSGEGIDEARAQVVAWLGLKAIPADKKNPGNKGRESGAHK